MSGAKRSRLILAVAVGVVALAVWAVSQTQRATADRIYDESQASHRMLTAMLDQETGLRGFALTRQREYLQPFIEGVRNFNIAAEEARSMAEDGERRPTVEQMIRLATRWRTLAEREIGLVGLSPERAQRPAAVAERKRLFDAFRRTSDTLQSALARDRDEQLARAELIVVVVILVLGSLFLVLGLYMIERELKRGRAARSRERHYRDTQAEFAETMQIMRDEAEAHQLVKNHLERAIEGADVTILNRNNSDNRLNAATGVDGAGPLADKLVDAEPDTCLAIRLGRPYEQNAGVDPLLACELCGRSAPEVLCTPSLVGGEVIGSVLVRGGRPLGEEERNRVDDSVAQASPVLANLRNLAIAQARAATDALTGLPNSRSCRDSVKRMVAHAGRAVEPLSAVMFDLDRFKQVNDRFGHGAGDDVLASVGEVLRSSLRGSDFGGRYGGEEFLVLLPSTDQVGAQELAEKLRGAIEALDFREPELKITASFGVATYPLDALDADGLVQMADRALYAAKSQGRNRVELVHATSRHQDVPQDA